MRGRNPVTLSPDVPTHPVHRLFPAPPVSRRQFLTTGTLMAASTAVLGPRAWAAEDRVRRIPLTRHARALPVGAWFPEMPAVDQLRALALAAIDAARRAGADDADIRIGMQRRLSVPDYPWPPFIGCTIGYGIRACVAGSWSFHHGNLLTTEAVVASAQNAVADAKTASTVNAALRAAAPPWTSAPVVTGEWRTPVVVDPFTVPLDDYHRVMASLVDATVHVHRNVRVGAGIGWQSELRVFASMSGSLVAQELTSGGPGVAGGASLPENPTDAVQIDVPALTPAPGGFELALRTDWIPHVLQGIDEAIQLRELPLRQMTDVGRYPMLFDGASFANLIGMTVNFALDGDRVAGFEADAAGRSFLTPLDTILGAATPYFSPLLTIRATPLELEGVARPWDDDGVVPEAYPLIEHGNVVDYHTTRATAPLLAPWYAKHGKPMRSHGCAVAATPASVPYGAGGHVQVMPSPTRVSLTDLHDTPRSFLVRGGNIDPDPGLTGGRGGWGSLIVEYRRGVPVTRLFVVPLQFVTKTTLQKNLVAIGDATTLRTTTVTASKGIPWQPVSQPISAPAALCKEIDVIPRVPSP